MSDRTDWDVIVIGAGLAGLSCAARLAKAGKKVVVLEQHSRPGGYWTSFSRRGFIFDISTHWVTDPYAINRILQDLGGPTVEFVQLENLGRYVGPPASRGRAGQPGTGPRPDPTAAIPAWDIMVGPDVEAFKKSVRASFPTRRRGRPRQAGRAPPSASAGCSTHCRSTPLNSPLPWRASRPWPSVASHLPRLRRLGTLPSVKYFERLFPGTESGGPAGRPSHARAHRGCAGHRALGHPRHRSSWTTLFAQRRSAGAGRRFRGGDRPQRRRDPLFHSGYGHPHGRSRWYTECCSTTAASCTRRPWYRRSTRNRPSTACCTAIASPRRSARRSTPLRSRSRTPWCRP